MTAFSAIAWVWVAGFWMGWGFREWGQRRADKHNIALWKQQLGNALGATVEQMSRNHRFVGDAMTTEATGSFMVNDVSYSYTITRRATQTIELEAE